ncbi:Glutathione peroxidase @ Thioredoxin peroxidase [hydrothermal vent metagenome]|uniref:Glutathione peroxidase @ Thioredoxin peroxidase n=1 Tax=hydrothermal vent metagenome TaxID=652676 RepID=A0A3B0V6S0_9ZZZZ
MSEFYDFKATTIAGDTVSMQDYQNNVVLIVNTASKCGLTSQFEGLQKLHEQYADKGLTILGFPCNQFAAQDPASNDEIAAFCIKNYGVDFTMFEKVNVNGKDAHPIFVYLKDELGGTLGKQIKWNFTKFLLGRDGEAIKRFSPKTKPKDIERFIEEALN